MESKVRYLTEVRIGIESLVVYRSPTGGIFGLDTTYVEQCGDEGIDPYTEDSFNFDEAENAGS